MKSLRLFFILFVNLSIAQEAVHNYGTLQMHGSGALGFHIDLINDGNFDNNVGLAGFYGYDKSLSISGSSKSTFYDTEIAVDRGLFLYTGINIVNNNNWIAGNIITTKSKKDVFINFVGDAFYIGESDYSLVDGYAAVTDKDSFVFPVGDDSRLRPLTISSTSISPFAKCAYFFENPNTPSHFGKSFNTERRSSEFLSISKKEFWHLESKTPATTTLTWDQYSDIDDLVKYVEDIKVVGWRKQDEIWVVLGNTAIEGEIETGKVTSDVFVPSDYEIITLGGNDKLLNKFVTIELDNYFISPNGDGKNDYLVLDGIETSPNNELQIFNRYGAMVYSKLRYNNEFNGISNRSAVVSRGSGLPSGVYFYVVTLLDLRQRHQGYLYLSATN